jgi:hypothetical protein
MTTRRVKVERVVLAPLGQGSSTWELLRQSASGQEYRYQVADGNSRSPNIWEFVVRVPDSSHREIEVRPVRVPNKRAWAGMERRSLILPVATLGRYRGKRYCRVPFPGVAGSLKSKRYVRYDQRDGLPSWFEPFQSRMRKKETVRRTQGTDGSLLVIVVDPDDHGTFVRLFFAVWVWPVSERLAHE